MATSDDALVKAWVTRRDADAFAEIVSRYSGMVYGTCTRILGNSADAEDVSQECFIQLTRAGGSVKRSVAGWLQKTAVSRSLNRLKAEQRRREREARFAAERTAHSEPEWDDVRVHIDEAIADLPDRLREPVILRFLQGQTHEAIARDLGISRTTVQYRLDRGIEQIRKFLNRRGVSVGAAALAAMLGANMTQAAPATLTAALGKLALAGAAGYAGASSATGIVSALGGLLSANKVIIALSAIAACLIALFALRTEPPPQPVAELAQEIPTTQAQPEQAPVGKEESGFLPELLKALSEKPAKEEPTATPSVSEQTPKTETPTPAESGTISGQVYDAETGEAVVETTVLAVIDGNRLGGKTQTDNLGRYQLTNLADNVYGVRVDEAKGYPWQGELINVTISNGRSIENVDLALVRGIRVAGKVLDQEGRPAEDVKVCGYSQGTSTYGRGKTNADGLFELYFLTAGTGLTVQACNDFFESEIVGPLTLPSEGIEGLTLKLTVPRTGSISGTIVDRAGRPLAEAQVVPSRKGDRLTGGSGHAESASDGSFSIANLPPGTYGILARDKEASVNSWPYDELTAVELKEGQALTELRLVLGQDRGGLAIAGRVVDEAGNPIWGAQVGCYTSLEISRTRSAVTGKDGRFRITGLAEGRYTVSAYRQGHSYRNLGVQVNASTANEDIVVVLERAASVEGRVLRADTGEPFTDFDVFYANGHSTGYDPRLFMSRQPVHDPNGFFRLKNVGLGDITVSARAPGFASDSVNLTLQGNEALTGVELRLEPAVPVSGRVVDTAGNPVSGARIYFDSYPPRAIGQTQNFEAESGADGEFVIDSVPSDAGSVVACLPNYAPGFAQVSENVVIVLESECKLEGEVTCGGSPVAEANVFIRYSDPDLTQRFSSVNQTRPDGSFSIGQLIPGTVQVWARKGRSSFTQTEPVEAVLEAGKTTVLDFAFEPGKATLEGRVTVRGKPPERANVRVRIQTTNGPQTHWAFTEPNGAYRLEGLQAGQASVAVGAFGPGDQQLRRNLELTIAEGQALRQDVDLSGDE